jgi:DNA-directed RNA polymerase specialized sigma24 family protein
MQIKYTFATRDTVEIEVNDGWAKELKELDRLEYNSNKKETRRHCSADTHFEKFGFEIADNADFVEKFLSKEIWDKLLKPLTAKQKELVYKKFVEKQRYTTIAKSEKVTPSAIQNRFERIFAKIKKHCADILGEL